MKKKQSKRRRKPTKKVPGWVEKQRKLNEPAPFNKKWSVEEKESILAYVHGEIPNDEVKACCYYEYARMSETLRKARRACDRSDPDNSLLVLSRYFPWWVHDQQRLWFLQCHNFPNLPWRDLTKEERENIRDHFKPVSPRPIITDVLMLRGTGVFDAFRDQAENASNEFSRWIATPKPESERKKPIRRVVQPAIVSGAKPFIKHVVITIDYRDGVDAVKEQFARWVTSEENQKLFKSYYKKLISKHDLDLPDRCKELLKFLAGWRLYGELGLKGAVEWTQENRRRYQGFGHRLPFFGERLRQTSTGKHYEGPLFKEPRQWEAATANATDFLASEIEFGQPDCGIR
jgi:hypothetical protein